VFWFLCRVCGLVSLIPWLFCGFELVDWSRFYFGTLYLVFIFSFHVTTHGLDLFSSLNRLVGDWCEVVEISSVQEHIMLGASLHENRNRASF
jgi:hypothetical protein